MDDELPITKDLELDPGQHHAALLLAVRLNLPCILRSAGEVGIDIQGAHNGTLPEYICINNREIKYIASSSLAVDRGGWEVSI